MLPFLNSVSLSPPNASLSRDRPLYLGPKNSFPAGKDIKILTEIFTPRQLVALVEEIGGKKVELKEISHEAFDATKNGGFFAAEIHGG